MTPLSGSYVFVYLYNTLVIVTSVCGTSLVFDNVSRAHVASVSHFCNVSKGVDLKVQCE